MSMSSAPRGAIVSSGRVRRNLRNRAAMTADLEGHPPPGTVRQLQTRRRDRRVRLRPRPRRTRPPRAPPPALVPHQHRAPSEAGQVGQRHPVAVLDPRRGVARRTALDALEPGLDMDPQRAVLDGKHPHPRETDETFEHDGCTVIGHRSPDQEVVLDTHILAGLLCCSTDPTPLKSDDPSNPTPPLHELPHGTRSPGLTLPRPGRWPRGQARRGARLFVEKHGSG